MTESLSPSTGWAVLHLFCRRTPLADGETLAAAVKSVTAETPHQVVPVAVLGHKADVALMALGPDLVRLRRLQTEVQDAGFEIVDSYVSLTELSEYAAGVPEPMRQARLFPQLPPPDKRAWCFYPMSKRRLAEDNWYLLPYDERERFMQGHGKVGRTFAGRVVQLITGSTGLDDHEWGVTLFAAHPDDLKDVVYTMRYDEASARYAEFGPFYTGVVVTFDELLELVGVNPAG